MTEPIDITGTVVGESVIDLGPGTVNQDGTVSVPRLSADALTVINTLLYRPSGPSEVTDPTAVSTDGQATNA